MSLISEFTSKFFNNYNKKKFRHFESFAKTILLEMFDASECCYRQLIRTKFKNNASFKTLSSSKYDINKIHCSDESLLENISNTKKYYSTCNKLGKGDLVLRIRIFSTLLLLENSILKKRVPIGEYPAIHSIFCMRFNTAHNKIKESELREFEEQLSYFYSHKIIADYHEVWHSIRRNIRSNSGVPIKKIYEKCLSSLMTANLPIKYGCFLMQTSSKKLNNKRKINYHLVKKKDMVFYEYLNENEKKFEFNKNVFLDLKSEGEKSIAIKWAKRWNNRYKSNKTSEFEYFIIKKCDSMFKNPTLEELEYSYVIGFPIIDQGNKSLNNHSEFLGICLLFLHPDFNDIGFFNKINLQLFAIAISSAIKTSVLQTHKMMSDYLNSISNLLDTRIKKFQDNVYNYINEELIQLENFEIWEMDNQKNFKMLYHFGEDENIYPILEVEDEDDLTKVIGTFTLRKKLIHSFYYNNLFSGFCMVIEGLKTKGLLLCKNRYSDANKRIVVPFESNDFEILKEIGNRLLFFHDSNKEKNRVISMARVIHHEISNAVTSLEQTIPYVEAAIPKEMLNKKIINNAISDIADIFSMLGQANNWTRIIQGDYRIKKEKIPILKIMYRWKHMYRRRIKAKNIEVKIPEFPAKNSPDYNQFYIDHPLIDADRQLIEQSLHNLLSNAIKYSYNGTSIEINTVVVRNNDQEEFLIFSISNFGIEIKSQYIKRIFDLFYRTENAKKITSSGEGTGTGLFLVERCMHLHKWPFAAPISNKISDYSLSYLYWLQAKDSWELIKNINFRNLLIQEYNRKESIINKIVSPKILNENCNFMINYTINRPTFKNTFYIKIPIGE